MNALARCRTPPSFGTIHRRLARAEREVVLQESFKLRHVHSIVGIFVIVIGLAALAGLAYAGKARRWFVAERRLTIILPEEGSMGLKAGAEVMILGVVVGSVISVVPDDAGRMSALVAVRTDFLRFVRTDSVVKITKTLGFAGDAFVEISGGKGAELPPTDAVLEAAADTDFRLARDLLAQVKTEIIPMVVEVRSAFAEARIGISELRDPAGDVRSSLASLRRVADEVLAGNGLLGQLLRDQEIPKELHAFLDKLHAFLDKMDLAMDESRLVLADLKRTSAILPDIAESTRDEVKKLPELLVQFHETLTAFDAVLVDLRRASMLFPGTAKNVDDAARLAPGVLLQAQDALHELERAAETIRRSWLLGGGEEPTPKNRLIAPEEVGGASRR